MGDMHHLPRTRERRFDDLEVRAAQVGRETRLCSAPPMGLYICTLIPAGAVLYNFDLLG